MKYPIRNWLFHLIAGGKIAYWMDDESQAQVAALSHVAGGGGAICLVKAMEANSSESATFDLDGWRITIERVTA